MGFGKDQQRLGSVQPFGAGATFQQKNSYFLKQQSESRQRKGGGGNLYGDKFVPTIEPNKLDDVRLIPGSYLYTYADKEKNQHEVTLEYWPFITHFDGREERSTICSAGVFHNFRDMRSPCHGCDLFWEPREMGPDGKKKKGRVSKSDRYVMNVLHYHPYHKIPQVDRESGTTRTNDKGEPYFEWVQCEGRLCKLCQQQVEVAPARLLKWEMGITHFKALTEEYQMQISNDCKNCGGRSSITTLAYVCQADGCGEAIIDMADTTLNDEQIYNIVNAPVTCAHCKQLTWLAGVFQCKTCATPERATIFDVDMKVRRMQGSEANSTQLIVSSWSNAHPIDPRFTSLVEKSFDLPKIYQPSDLDFQARQFRLGGAAASGAPVQRTPVNSGFRQYAGQQQQGNPGAGGGGQGPNYGS